MGAFIDRTLETFELMAVAITELRQRVEGLEKREPNIKVSQAKPLHERHLDEADRSHVISVGESHYHL